MENLFNEIRDWLLNYVVGRRLLKAFDQHYDDSLVLAQIPQKYLQRIILPLGDFPREVAQSTAVNAGFSNFYCVRRHNF